MMIGDSILSVCNTHFFPQPLTPKALPTMVVLYYSILGIFPLSEDIAQNDWDGYFYEMEK